MSENEAEVIDLEIAILDLVAERGNNIASQQWRSGSWCDVYEYKDRYFAVDEFGVSECGSAGDAFGQAGIGRDIYDEISHLSVAPEYQHLVAE